MSGSMFDSYLYFNCLEMAFQNKHDADEKDKVAF